MIMAATAANNRGIQDLVYALNNLSVRFQETRRKPTKYSVTLFISLSVIIFVGIMAASMALIPGDSLLLGNTASNTIGERFQFSLVISASAGVIPGIAYAILRDQEVQRKNDELAALSQEIRHYRSNIVLLKQEEAAKHLQ
ncbi:MAG: hypothetical protein AUH71_05530 [Thaumarchaeota archaeon 13_1_40CM_4_48_7]|nr:MAG: hypothetical protein AUH71_05530 [Thaumarchaeota archaeon 13_1_40CM_4_48_7]OLC92694.1 MAG: hypothetical protein AUI92_04635 [Thaumarchaeota archaeon 13_1_40CM_3_38_6]